MHIVVGEQLCPWHSIPLIVVYDRVTSRPQTKIPGFERHCVVCLLDQRDRIAHALETTTPEKP